MVITGCGRGHGFGGLGWKPNAERFSRRPNRAFRPVSQFDVTRQRVKIAAEVDLPAFAPAFARPAGQPAASLTGWTAPVKCWCWPRRKPGSKPAGNPTPKPGAENLPLVLGTTAGGMLLGRSLLSSGHPTASAPHFRQQATRAVHYPAPSPGAHAFSTPSVAAVPDHDHFQCLQCLGAAMPSAMRGI